MDDEIIHYLRGSGRLGALYEKWTKKNGFEGEYMDDLLASARLDAAQREWLSNLEFHYIRALRREKLIESLTSPLAMIFYFFVLTPVLLGLIVSFVIGGGDTVARDDAYELAFLVFCMGAVVGYLTKSCL